MSDSSNMTLDCTQVIQLVLIDFFFPNPNLYIVLYLQSQFMS